MKKRKPFELLAASVCLLLTGILSPAASALANSAQTWWQGTDSTGALIADTDCPIVVESELLTFDISEFPSEYYPESDEYLAYHATVTAEYSLSNPADYTVTARLLFPFGNAPSYAPSHDRVTEETEDIADNTAIMTDNTQAAAGDTAKYDITVNGKVIPRTLRHSFSYPDESFELDEDFARLTDGYLSDSFYTPDLPVTKYTYTVSDVDEETYPAANVAFDVSEPNGKKRLLFAQQSGMQETDKKNSRLSAWAENGMTLTVYCIGEPDGQKIKWSFYQNGSTENGTEIDGTAALTSTEHLTFKDLALSARREDSPVSESDWYNAVVHFLQQNENACGVIMPDLLSYGNDLLDISGLLMRWYEYTITLEPGERIVNTVTAPVYPKIDKSSAEALYTYTYLLSPAKTWKSFGSLDIVIRTPFYMAGSTWSDWEKTADGYQRSLDALPLGELNFTLSATETAQTKSPEQTSQPMEMQRSVSVISIILGGVLLIAGVVLLILGIKKIQTKK